MYKRQVYVHAVIDDYFCLVYAEIHDGETAITATAVLVGLASDSTPTGILPKPNAAVSSTPGCITTTGIVPTLRVETSRRFHV